MNTNRHIQYLDGLRGLAAFCVLLYHCQLLSLVSHDKAMWTDSPVSTLARCLQLGHFAVPVFIVLSGYCLMLPVAQGDHRFRDGVAGFFKRRARRILPPYYAALALAIGGMFVAHRVLHVPLGLQAKDVALHALMLENFFAHYSRTIDPPMWSVATECDIYVLFAGVLLPALRKFGWGAVFTAAALIGFAPHFLLPERRNLDWLGPWFAEGFAIGMFTAWVTVNKRPMPSVLSQPVVGWILGIASVTAGAISIAHTVDGSAELLSLPKFAGDTIVELAAALLIYRCSVSTPAFGVRQMLEWRPFVKLGEMSYSLYLVHQILLINIINVLAHRPVETIFLTTLACVPLIIIFCYIFHLIFEKPFLNKPASISTAKGDAILAIQTDTAATTDGSAITR